jgi:small subunit ribosomal protein S24e
MEVTITQQQYNALLKRKEITFAVDHRQIKGTPTRIQVRNALADMLKTKPEVVYIKRITTKAGTMTATGEANAYDSIEHANRIEQKHIIARNTPKEKKEDTEKTEAPAPPPPAEKTEKPPKAEG